MVLAVGFTRNRCTYTFWNISKLRCYGIRVRFLLSGKSVMSRTKTRTRTRVIERCNIYSSKKMISFPQDDLKYFQPSRTAKMQQ